MSYTLSGNFRAFRSLVTANSAASKNLKVQKDKIFDNRIEDDWIAYYATTGSAYTCTWVHNENPSNGNISNIKPFYDWMTTCSFYSRDSIIYSGSDLISYLNSWYGDGSSRSRIIDGTYYTKQTYNMIAYLHTITNQNEIDPYNRTWYESRSIDTWNLFYDIHSAQSDYASRLAPCYNFWIMSTKKPSTTVSGKYYTYRLSIAYESTTMRREYLYALRTTGTQTSTYQIITSSHIENNIT